MGAQQACCCSSKEPEELHVNRPSCPEPLPGNPKFSEMGQLEKLAKASPASLLEPRHELEKFEQVTPMSPPEPHAVRSENAQEQTVKWDDGSSYTGQMQDHKRHGHGRWESAGAGYEGEWFEDNMHGQGKQTWRDGRVYEGQFEHGRFSGRGKMTWQAQKGVLVYEGEYKDDMKHGEGRFQWPDGRAYDGQWKLGKREGRGVYTNSQQEQKVGYWKNNQWERWEEEDLGGKLA